MVGRLVAHANHCRIVERMTLNYWPSMSSARSRVSRWCVKPGAALPHAMRLLSGNIEDALFFMASRAATQAHFF